LEALDRLPPDQNLAIGILMSIESMYADLALAENDEERLGAVREAFPNEAHLRTAMLALIELLDPSVDTKDPVIRDADVEALIKIVLFEERRRREGPRASAPPSPPPANGRRSRSAPPPLPSNGAAPLEIDADVELEL
jgi:hypothetical protein